MSNIFLTATRMKVRFQSVQGLLSVEDLWELPLTTTRTNKASIESIGAVLLSRQVELAKVQGSSILGTDTSSPELTKVNLQVALLRKVAEIRQAENKAKTETAARKSEKARLDALISEREGMELPLADLKARRDSLIA